VKIHPSDLVLEEMLLGDGRDSDALLIHVAACPYCRARMRSLPIEMRRRAAAALPSLLADGASGGGRSEAVSIHSRQNRAYGAILDRSERKYLERARLMHVERSQAPELVAELLAHEPRKRSLLAANTARFHTWGVYEALLDRCWDLRSADPRLAEDLAQLALHLSSHLDCAFYSRELIDDLRARAWAYVANLRRVASDLEGAEKAFEASYAHLKQGTREPFERAMYLDLKASLRRAQRRFDEATRLLNRAAAIFLHQGDPHRAGKSLVNLSTVHEAAGQTEQAIATLQRAVGLIDPATDERLLLDASHNLICYLITLERYIEARGVYRNARPLYMKHERSGYANRRLWIKGNIERGLGQRESAERLLLAARQGFLDREIPYEAALVSLDVAVLYAEQKRTAELKRLAGEALPIFTSLGIQREALAALLFLKQAADAERLSVEVAARLADFLRRAQGDPSLKFEAPA
jgi:tetratricopeptide (TPR) repeat protein